MDIRIYQIDLNRDMLGVSFQNLDNARDLLGSNCIDSSLYRMVYDGSVDAEDLESVFEIFNHNKPEGYGGRSLSVSDVVEVVRSEEVWPGCYYCDDIGFPEVSFDTDIARDLEPQLIDVVMVKPGRNAYVTRIDSSLTSMQNIVGGFLEAVYPFEENVCILCNEDGKLDGLPLNRALKDGGEIYDIIAGTFFLCGFDDEKFTGLAPEQLEKYKQEFLEPQRFFRKNGKILATPYTPREPEQERA